MFVESELSKSVRQTICFIVDKVSKCSPGNLYSIFPYYHRVTDYSKCLSYQYIEQFSKDVLKRRKHCQ